MNTVHPLFVYPMCVCMCLPSPSHSPLSSGEPRRTETQLQRAAAARPRSSISLSGASRFQKPTACCLFIARLPPSCHLNSVPLMSPLRRWIRCDLWSTKQQLDEYGVYWGRRPFYRCDTCHQSWTHGFLSVSTNCCFPQSSAVINTNGMFISMSEIV